MIETLVALGVFGSFPTREHDGELVGHANRVEHLVLGITRVHVKALESNLSHSSVEVLEFEFTHLAAVHSVGEVGAEKVDVEFVSTEANFFVGIESDANFAKAIGQLSLDLNKAIGGDGVFASQQAKEQCYYRFDIPFRNWLMDIDPENQKNMEVREKREQ